MMNTRETYDRIAEDCLRDLCMDISYEQREMSGKTRWLQIVGQKR